MTTEHAHATQGYDKPLPVVHPDNQPYWDSLKAHHIKMQKCLDCGTLRYPVSPVCYKCFSWKHEWADVKGTGKLSAWLIVHQTRGDHAWPADVPFNVALVDLDDGPRLTTNIVDAAPEDLHPGMPVELVYVDVTPEVTLARFKPVSGRK